MQKQKGISSIIFIVIIIALLTVAGFYVYKYYSVPKANTTPAPQTQSNQQNQDIDNQQSPTSEKQISPQIQVIKDCGISDSMTKNVPLDKIDFEKDMALVCLGQSIANNCTNAKAVLKGSINGNEEEELVEISGADFDSCKIKETITKNSTYPLYINQYIECLTNKINAFGTGKIKTPAEILKNPGNHAGGLIAVISLFFLKTDQAIEELGCTTNFNSADLK